MRFPFDLICAVLVIEGMSKFLVTRTTAAEVFAVTPGTAILYWCGFWLVCWLANDLVVRGTERRTAYGRNPSGRSGTKHPFEIHTWGVRIAQATCVAMFALVLWKLKWPIWVTQWPFWLGFEYAPRIGRLSVAGSTLIGTFFNLTPFLIGAVIGWLPRRRLLSGARQRPIPLRPYLLNEIRLSWLILPLWIVLYALSDIAQALPGRYTAWMDEPFADILVTFGFLGFILMIVLPWMIIHFWDCRPLPDGELKTRLEALMQRSGIKARSILVWGRGGSGLLNACVFGPWSRFRFVLISPDLVAELSPDESEAVLAHELGHVKYGHLSLQVAMIVCMSALTVPILQFMSESWRVSPLMQVFAVMGFIIAYMFGFFGTILRQCEREADLASAELLGTPQPLIMALEKLALLTGNIRNVYCWHHGSIAQRVTAVQMLSGDPEGCVSFHQRQRRLRRLFTALTIVAVGAQIFVRLA